MGRTIQAEGVILRSLRLGEADRVLHVYTRERGRVGVVAKGVRRTRSRFGARLEPLTRVNLVLHLGRGELGTVTGADIVASHRLVREDPERLAVGLAGAETVAQAVRGGRGLAEGLRGPLPVPRGAGDAGRSVPADRARAPAARPRAQAPLGRRVRARARPLRGLRGGRLAARALLGCDRWRDVRRLPGRVRDPPGHARGTRSAASRAARRGACAPGAHSPPRSRARSPTCTPSMAGFRLRSLALAG